MFLNRILHLHFLQKSVAIVSVNEIMKDPNTLPASEGDIPSYKIHLEEIINQISF